MLKLLLLSLVAVAVVGFIRSGNVIIDQVGQFTVEYDDEHNIIVLVSERECFIVEAPDSSWDPLVRDRSDLHAASLAIVRQINRNTGITKLSQREAASEYDSRLEQLECITKSIFRVAYTPTRN